MVAQNILDESAENKEFSYKHFIQECSSMQCKMSVGFEPRPCNNGCSLSLSLHNQLGGLSK